MDTKLILSMVPTFPKALWSSPSSVQFPLPCIIISKLHLFCTHPRLCLWQRSPGWIGPEPLMKTVTSIDRCYDKRLICMGVLPTTLFVQPIWWPVGSHWHQKTKLYAAHNVRLGYYAIAMNTRVARHKAREDITQNDKICRNNITLEAQKAFWPLKWVIRLTGQWRWIILLRVLRLNHMHDDDFTSILTICHHQPNLEALS